MDNITDIDSYRLFCGPEFLHSQEEPHFDGCSLASVPLDTSDPEVKVSSILLPVVKTDLLEHLTYSSSWFKAKRALADSLLICKFWYERAVLRKAIKSIKCSTADLEAAQLIIIKSVESKFFGEGLLKLSKGNSVTEASKLLNLNPILVNGVVRVGGRLQAASSQSLRGKTSNNFSLCKEW